MCWLLLLHTRAPSFSSPPQMLGSEEERLHLSSSTSEVPCLARDAGGLGTSCLFFIFLYSKWLSMLVSLSPLDLLSHLYLEVEGDLVSGDPIPGWLRDSRWWKPCGFPGCRPDFRVVMQAWAWKFTFFLHLQGSSACPSSPCGRQPEAEQVGGPRVIWEDHWMLFWLLALACVCPSELV